MKRNVLIHTILISAFCVGGFSSGRWLREDMSQASARESGAPDRHSPDRPAHLAGASRSATAAHDLAALREFSSSLNRDDTPEAGQMARLSTEELKAMVVSLFATTGSGGAVMNIPHSQTIAHACRELYYRDGPAAYTWAEGLSPEKLGKQACNIILSAAAPREPALAEEWAKRYREKYGETVISTMSGTFLRGLMEQGDLAGITGFLARNEIDEIYCPSINFPDDFNFPALFKALDGKTQLSSPMSRWALRDPDAAWKYITEHHPSGKSYPEAEDNLFSNIFHASILRDGSDKGVAWALQKMTALSPEQRASFLGSLKLHTMEFPPEASTSFVSALSETDRQTIVSGMRDDGLSNGKTAQRYLNILKVLPREEMIGELTAIYQTNRSAMADIEATESPTNRYSTGHRVRQGFAAAEESLHLTKEELHRIRSEDQPGPD